MLDFRSARIASLVVHVVGNKLRQEGVQFSKEMTAVSDDSIQRLLHQYFLRPFLKAENFYRFSHCVDLKLNESFHYVRDMFSDTSLFVQESNNLAKHLYEQSTHPKIQSGEFFIALIKDAMVDNLVVDAIGLFKTEYKETYLKVYPEDNGYGVGYDQGININRLDKGCLIFSIEEDMGYRVAIIDIHNRAEEEARYWKDMFLCLSPLQSASALTTQHMLLGSQLLKTIESTNKPDSLELQAKVLNYFKDNANFELESFSRTVIGDNEDMRDRFVKLRDDFYGDSDPGTFTIAQDQVEKFKRQIRNSIHLDTNIDIVIRGADLERTLNQIERGYDSKRSKNYYKIYFDQEH